MSLHVAFLSLPVILAIMFWVTKDDLNEQTLTASEEFFRLKKVQGKKKRDAEKTQEDRSKQNAEFEKDGGQVHKDEGVGGGAAGGGDMLNEGKDEDVIF